MAANDTSAPERKMVRISKEKPTPLWWWIKTDWKLPWLVFTAVSSVMVIAIGTFTPLWWIGWPYAFFAITVYLTMVQIPWFEGRKTPVITVLHRKAQKHYRQLTGGDWYLSLDPHIGEVFGIAGESRNPPKPIKALGRIRFMPHTVATKTAEGVRKSVLGVAEDGRNTLAGTLKVTTESLFSVDADTRQRRLSAFAHLLDTLTQGYVHRLAWQDTTLLGEHADPDAFLEEIAKASNLKRAAAPNREVLRKWIDDNNQNKVVHETTITLAVHRLTIRGEAKQMGGDYRKVLEETLRNFYATIIGKGGGSSPLGLTSAKFLSYNDLVMLNLLRLDPVFAQPLWQQWRRPRDSDYLLNEKLAWPDASDFRSGDIVRLGETYHLGYYVDEFGESGMMQDAFWELLGVPVPKTVSVVFQMVPWSEAKRTAKRYRTGVTGYNVDRAKENQLVYEEHEWALEEAVTHEREVARSMGQVGRIRCYIDVTGDSPEQAHGYARLLRSAVTTNTPFVLRPLTNRQLRGIEALMPLARGLR